MFEHHLVFLVVCFNPMPCRDVCRFGAVKNIINVYQFIAYCISNGFLHNQCQGLYRLTLVLLSDNSNRILETFSKHFSATLSNQPPCKQSRPPVQRLSLSQCFSYTPRYGTASALPYKQAVHNSLSRDYLDLVPALINSFRASSKLPRVA